MYDFIGDIHGHADKLEMLLEKLGYRKEGGVYRHAARNVIFVGDYIDRGPQIREALQIVRNMVESGQAIALMGNHEYNAICFHYKDPNGGHLRKHNIKNILQHCETLRQFKNLQKEYNDYVEWFLTLPLFWETDCFRAVHACWDAAQIEILKKSLKKGRLTKELVYASAEKGTPLYKAVDITLKGREMVLPEGVRFEDKDGIIRKDIRVKWWADPTRETLRSYSVTALSQLPELPVVSEDCFYSSDERPVFFGHYWLEGQPAVFRENICCLDYSVAKEGHLVAYSLDNERQLNNVKLTFV